MIAVNLFRQYLFCPRIVYFSLLTNIKPIYPKHVKMGEDYHTLQDKLESSRNFKKLKIDFIDKISNKYLEDTELEICGKVDLGFVTNEEVFPVEFKFTENKKPSYGHAIQLFAYGLLMKKKFVKDLNSGFIISSNNLKTTKIEFTKTIERDFFKILQEINTIVENGNFPDSSADGNKCYQCEYLNYCNDRF